MPTFAELNEEVTRTKSELDRVEKELAFVRQALEAANDSIERKDRALTTAASAEVSLRERVKQLEQRVAQAADDLWERVVVACSASPGSTAEGVVQFADKIIALRLGKMSQKMSKKNASGATSAG